MSMNLCSDGHDEICYEGRISTPCPACEIITEKEEEIAQLEIKCAELEKQINDL